ncbi:hypothetical protein CLI64_08135 [Nostoc sp. CENA543]|uniref:hypothetical protein n=1 Tax=Nostoc sp. CENA543 TaxID=1869241 RepID=UPI000CA23151|nr:hypothetical protein [Nostoc sp. CENA543]AUT00357.1 hypothetical protein CLI64_08135 [Nostoc sp. CENA543]
MTTIKDLKTQASDLGLSNEYVKNFGKLSAKATWQLAIDSHLATTSSQPVVDEPPSVEPNQPSPALTTPQPTSHQTSEHAQPMLLFLVLVVVITTQLITTVLPIVTYLYTSATNHVKHQREIRRRRSQWYAELRQLMTT